MTGKEWIERAQIKANRRAYYNKYFATTIEGPMKLLGFTKREITRPGGDPRAIQQLDPVSMVKVGAATTPADRFLKKRLHFFNRVTYAAGLSPEHMGLWFEMASENVGGSDWCRALIGGDDCIVVCEIHGKLYFITGDVSRQDAHIYEETVQHANELLTGMGVPTDATNLISQVLGRLPGRFTSRWGEVKYIKEFGMPSGAPITSWYNTFVISVAIDYWMQTADGGPEERLNQFVDAFRQIGLPSEASMTDNPWETSFFSRWFCPVEPYHVEIEGMTYETRIVLTADIGRAVCKFGHKVNEIDDKTAMRWLAGVCVQGTIDFSHLPIMRRIVLKLSKAVEGLDPWYENGFIQEKHNLMAHRPSTATYLWVIERHHISMAQICECEQYIDGLPATVPLDLRNSVIADIADRQFIDTKGEHPLSLEGIAYDSARTGLRG
jgi:hypothetical protein